MMITRDERKEIAQYVSVVGRFKETTIGYKAMESLLHMGEWSFHWFDKKFCLEMAMWLQHLGLAVIVKSDAVVLTDEAIEQFYVNVMGRVPEIEPQYNTNLSKRERRLSIGKEERETSNWAERILADKSDTAKT